MNRSAHELDKGTDAAMEGEAQRPPVRKPVIRQMSAKQRVTPTRNRTELQHSRLRRTKSAENRLTDVTRTAADSHLLRSGSPSTWSASRASVVTSASSGSVCVSGLMLKMAPERDRACSRALHIGDRVYVDMSRGKGEENVWVKDVRASYRFHTSFFLKLSDKRKLDFQQAVIKFIGNLDKDYDCYRLYIGVKLDDPGKYRPQIHSQTIQPPFHPSHLTVLSVYTSSKKMHIIHICNL